jgi:3-keto-disaccharide hydrolase
MIKLRELAMTRLTLLLLLVAAPAAFAQKGWISLFNGKDFTGWKVGGDQSTFKIKDGAMVANGPVAHAFYDGPVDNHDFKNFELMVDVMAAPNSNGGIYFHTEFQESGFPKKGFEVQVNNTFVKDPIKSGSLYHVKDIGVDDIKGITKDNEWFTEHIIVQDKTVTIKLNGKEVVKWTQPADWNGGREGAGRVLGHGTIALQGHDPNSTVYYKNIRIKPLP